MVEYLQINLKSAGYDQARLKYLERENKQQKTVIAVAIWIITFLIWTVIYISGIK